MPEKGATCPAGRYAADLLSLYRSYGGALSLPRQTRRILRGLDGASVGISRAFDGAARLYQVGLIIGSRFPSAGLAYRVAAVDALAQAEGKDFGSFVREYTQPYKGRDEGINRLYGEVRSAHFHGGDFPMGEFDRIPAMDALLGPDAMQQGWLGTLGFPLARAAIVGWLTKVIPDMVDKTTDI